MFKEKKAELQSPATYISTQLWLQGTQLSCLSWADYDLPNLSFSPCKMKEGKLLPPTT